MKIAHFRMTNELLWSLLNLPEGSKVVQVNACPDTDRDFQVWVTSPDFPESETKDEAPQCRPVFQCHYQQVAHLETWGLDE